MMARYNSNSANTPTNTYIVQTTEVQTNPALLLLLLVLHLLILATVSSRLSLMGHLARPTPAAAPILLASMKAALLARLLMVVLMVV